MTPFLKILPEVITFGCTPEGEAALAAMRALPRLLDRRTRVTAADIDHALLSGSWKSLVLPKPGGIDRNAYASSGRLVAAGTDSGPAEAD